MHQLAFSWITFSFFFPIFFFFFLSKLANAAPSDLAKTDSKWTGFLAFFENTHVTQTVHLFFDAFQGFTEYARWQVVNAGIHIFALEAAISFTMRQNECRFRGHVNSSTLHFLSLDNAFWFRVRFKYFKHATTVSGCMPCRVIRYWNTFQR